MYPTYKIKTGYYGVVYKSNTTIGKAISRFTGGYSHTINFVWGTYNNHFGLWVFEMKQLPGKHDCKRTLYQESEYYKKDNWFLMAPLKDYSLDEEKKFKYILDYAYENYSYDNKALIRHLVFIVTGRFPEEKVNDNKIVCSHLTALAVNNAKPYTFIDPECVNPRHCAINKFHKKIKLK